MVRLYEVPHVKDLEGFRSEINKIFRLQYGQQLGQRPATVSTPTTLVAKQPDILVNPIIDTSNLLDGTITTNLLVDLAAPFAIGSGGGSWQASTHYNNGYIITVDNSGRLQMCTHTGTSGGSKPSFSHTPGQLTTDGSVIWEALGTGTAYSSLVSVFGPQTILVNDPQDVFHLDFKMKFGHAKAGVGDTLHTQYVVQGAMVDSIDHAITQVDVSGGGAFVDGAGTTAWQRHKKFTGYTGVVSVDVQVEAVNVAATGYVIGIVAAQLHLYDQMK